MPLTETNIEVSDESIDNLNEESNSEKNSENHLNDETINNFEKELNLSQHSQLKIPKEISKSRFDMPSQPLLEFYPRKSYNHRK